ncbi:hypothetical protein O4G76_15830 [Limimaricola sp. G21655-S1]|uniref:hypothetical protein n=1 Tax=Limimaricola sp. G21655-S1 TaxID=3014768 RepID=UPI0022AECD62|nr:hypothetical protein [Limimaricola sp. G21655-S1]MCZ4262310.1 hypothetical protein [Limimaricola sp. G21655-S1]
MRAAIDRPARPVRFGVTFEGNSSERENGDSSDAHPAACAPCIVTVDPPQHTRLQTKNFGRGAGIVTEIRDISIAESGPVALILSRETRLDEQIDEVGRS